MKKDEFSKLSLNDLQFQRNGLLDRIKRLESDLKCPLVQDSSEQAMEVSNKAVLAGILNAEREYLMRVEKAMAEKKEAYS